MFSKQKKSGWIGIDAGSTSLKVVQLESSNGILRVRSRICIPRTKQNDGICRLKDATSQEYQSDSVRGEISAALELSLALEGRRCAVAPSMADCEIHRIADKEAREQEFASYVRESVAYLTATSVADRQLDCWSTRESQTPGAAGWNVISLPTPVSDQLYDDLSLNRLRCQKITGLPQALACAVSLTARQDFEKSVAVLDWGVRVATFAVIRRGSPVYVRALKNCGYDRMITQLGKYLEVNSWEAQRLLRNVGIASEENSTLQESLLVKEAVAEPLRQIQSEIKRTLDYLRFQRQSLDPQSLQLFGGGALTPGIADHLERKLQLPTSKWSFDRSESENDLTTLELDAQYGAAFGLSALAWEA
jgi:Tfp pilus assembly PilM family ATPase